MSERPKDPKDPRQDLAGALHDVSNALTVLLGWVSEARSPSASTDAVGYALRMIEERARAARDLARRAIGVDVPRGEKSDHAVVDVVVAETVDALAVEARARGVALELASPPVGEHVPWASDLTQILTNLVMNALAHSPAGGAVRVYVDESVRGVHVDVQDEGPGVPDARRGTVFEGDTTRPGGAGVGLRHARAVARACGGDLELVPSTGEPGAGALFRITWPRVGSMPSVPPSQARPRVLEGLRILIVEDDSDVIGLLETALGARGAAVVVARTAAELASVTAVPPPPSTARSPSGSSSSASSSTNAAVAAVTRAAGGGSASAFDAALIDLSPIAEDVDGALAAIRQVAPDAVLVGMTGSAQGLPPSLVALGARCVRKPFEVSEIIAALARRP